MGCISSGLFRYAGVMGGHSQVVWSGTNGSGTAARDVALELACTNDQALPYVIRKKSTGQ